MRVVKIGAEWCSACLVMKPRWQEIEAENPWLETVFYDFDLNKEEVEKFNIKEEIPVFIFFDKEGNEFLRLSGEIEKEKLIEIISENKEK